MIVLDASALIAQLDEHDVHHRRTRELLGALAEETLGASVITLAEALVAPARVGRLDESRSLLRELEVASIGLGHEAVWQLAALRAETGLRMPDCCVLLAAATVGSDVILTFDARLATVAAARGLGTPGDLPEGASAGMTAPPPMRSRFGAFS